jgi:transcriptional regulator with XRE-family HTH domain
MNNLQAFITSHGIKQAEFAASIGATQSMVSRLINGAAIPSLSLAAKIERATGGAVPASSWIPEADPTPTDPSTPTEEDAA